MRADYLVVSVLQRTPRLGEAAISIKVVFWSAVALFGLIKASFSTTALPAFGWTALSVFGCVSSVLSSKILSRKIAEPGDTSHWSMLGVVLTGLMLFIPTVTWWEWLSNHYGPAWQPVEREELYSVSGQLQVRYGNYAIITPARPVLLNCYRYSSSRGPNLEQDCLPDNVQNYVGRQVKVLLPQPLENQYQVTFYEITSGNDVLFSYDRISKHQVERDKRRRTRSTLTPAVMTVCCISPLVIVWVCYARARKRHRLSDQNGSGHVDSTDK